LGGKKGSIVSYSVQALGKGKNKKKGKTPTALGMEKPLLVAEKRKKGG